MPNRLESREPRLRTSALYHVARRLRCACAAACLTVAWICTGSSVLGLDYAYAQPVDTLVRSVQPDGSEVLGSALAELWQAATSYDAGSLAVARIADPRQRLRALRTGRASFAILDGGAYAQLRPDFPDISVLSALIPLTVHVLMRGGEPGPLTRIPGTIVYNEGARSIAIALAQTMASQTAAGNAAAAPPPATVQAPLLRPLDPIAALDLLRRSAPDAVVLIAAPSGTADIAKLLNDEPSVRLIGLARPLLDAVRSDRAWISSTLIPRGSYPNQTEAVETPSIPLLLLTLPSLPGDDARRMLDCLYNRREQVAGVTSLFAAMDRRSNADVAKWAPFHPTAVKAFGLPAQAQTGALN